MLGDVDPQLLLVLKTTHLTRSINRELGAIVNRYLLMGRWGIIGLHTKPGMQRSFWDWVLMKKDMLELDISLAIYNTSMYIYMLYRKFNAWWYSKKFETSPVLVRI